MRSRSNLPIFIAYTVISLVVLGFMATQMGGEFFLQSPYHFKAVFASGTQLVAGDDVTIAGLRVGRVDSLSPGADGTVAQLAIHQDYAPLYGDARAVIQVKNLLGETYVDVNRGSRGNGAMADGDSIPRSRTLVPVEIAQVLDALNPDVRQQLANVINTLGETTAGRGQDLGAQAPDLEGIATALRTLAKTLASNADHLDSLISSLTKVLQTLAAWHTEFRALITDWDTLMKTLASRESALQGTIKEQDRVMAIFDQALAGQAAPNLHSAIAQAPGALDSVDHYLNDSAVVFGELAQPQNTGAIGALFLELSSVMSYTEPGTGQHHWRVYNVGVSGSVPCTQANLCPGGP
jgi:phospholipid/cholesterol/gamma-HCH transport system substrate-binding protein